MGHNLKEFLSGAAAGFVYATASFTFDLLKSRAQTSTMKRMQYRDEISRIYNSEGLLGFSLGYKAMALRDIFSFGLYFALYDYNKRYLLSRDPLISDEKHHTF